MFHGNVGIRKALTVSRMHAARVGGHRRGFPRSPGTYRDNVDLFCVCVYYCRTYYKAVRVGGGG